MKHKFLSYGAGMQTFALLVMAEQGEIDIDEVVFADTGAEHMETYHHIEEVAKPICNRIGIPFTTVRMQKEVDDISGLSEREIDDYKAMLRDTSSLKSRTERINAHKEYAIEHEIPRRVVSSLRDEIIARRRVPSINPSSRWCTSDAKLIPIHRGFIRLEQQKGNYIKPCTALIGLSYEELTRMYKPHLTEYVVEYPLIDKKMTRKDCVAYVERFGYNSPPKSGCYFCPFQGKAQWRSLLHTHPDMYWDAVGMEEADLNYPTYGLYPQGIMLRKLAAYFSDSVQTRLEDGYKEEMFCEQAGYCGV